MLFFFLISFVSIDLAANTGAILNPSEPPPLPVHILPPAANTDTPTPVPLLIPSLPTGDPSQTEPVQSGGSSTSIDYENLAAILERLQIPDNEGLQDFIKQAFDEAAGKCSKLQVIIPYHPPHTP